MRKNAVPEHPDSYKSPMLIVSGAMRVAYLVHRSILVSFPYSFRIPRDVILDKLAQLVPMSKPGAYAPMLFLFRKIGLLLA